MIGDESVHPDRKFVELFKRMQEAETLISTMTERLEELTAALGKPPGRKETLHLNGRPVARAPS